MSEADSTDHAEPVRPAEAPDSARLAEQQFRLIEATLAALPEKTCRAFVMHTIDGVSTPEVARILKISERMVRVLVAQAYDKCRMRLDSEERSS